MAYLIDGNNLIGAVSTLSLDDPDSRSALIGRLRNFQKVRNTRIILVFDGPPDPDLPFDRLRTMRFSIHYPDPGSSADSVIHRLIDRQTDRRRFFVVSTDREIRDHARKEGARVIRSEDFDKMLRQAGKEVRELNEMTKPEDRTSPLEVRMMTELFEDEK